MIAAYVIITIVSFCAMEFVAWFTHKYIMHGLLWVLHKDHHTGHKHAFERNDAFFVIFALPGASLIIAGSMNGFNELFFAGLGITLYGAAYFLVHDVFIHQRFKLFRNSTNPYLLAIRRAHKVHHKKTEKNGGECFGMLIVPMKYFRNELGTLAKQS